MNPISKAFLRTPPICVAILSIFVVLFWFGPARAGTFTVTETAISGAGPFPAVINQANSTLGCQTVQFALGGTFMLGSALPVITNSMTINGRTDVAVIITDGGTLPIFTFAAGTTTVLSQLCLINALAAAGGGGGGAINNAGVLYVSSCSFTNAAGQAGRGGAIPNNGGPK